ncbi:hypothetical protein [Nocardia abscessus]|uniref:hypothetical protein n=1 Tax=Nocardia abscessus TaxID=120957 RepID=UPI002457C41D|nr:hypothetical protein [Nocardia abscessus]
MEFTNDMLTIHTDKARLVAANGGELSKEWKSIESRYEAYFYRQSSVIDDLCEAVLNGAEESELNLRFGLAMAKALGISEGANDRAEGVINSEVRNRVAGALTREYNKTADENLKRVAATFNLNLEQFRALTEQVDVEASAESLITAPDGARMAWLKAEQIAAELDNNLAGLAAAASLAGARISGNDALIGLVCPTDGVGKARRALWKAWDTDGRTGRWGALLAAGIDVKGIDSVQRYRTYGRPQHVRIDQEVHIGAGAYGTRQTWVDTEDGSPIEQ